MGNTEISADISLGIEGFEFADLFRPERLKDLAEIFEQELVEANPELFSRWEAYRRDPSSIHTPVEISALLVGVSSHVSRFLARLFRIEKEVEDLAARTMEQDP